MQDTTVLCLLSVFIWWLHTGTPVAGCLVYITNSADMYIFLQKKVSLHLVNDDGFLPPWQTIFTSIFAANVLCVDFLAGIQTTGCQYYHYIANV